MIGLGSNRMSVCRRGGMSVTQAGRGGMEWLAGGRMPSWASPYSVPATAALKAQFPTQWPTIRDYGVAHPEIVGYMNAEPMFWGYLIANYSANVTTLFDTYQMCEYIEGTGSQWLQQPMIDTTGDFFIEMDFAVVQYGGSWTPLCTNKKNPGGVWIGGNSNKFVVRQLSGSDCIQATRPAAGTWCKARIELVDTTLTLYLDGVAVGTYTNPSFPISTDDNYLFSDGFGTLAKAKFKRFQHNGGCLIACYNKTSGVIGMYDVVQNAFRTNMGSGTFLKGQDV